MEKMIVMMEMMEVERITEEMTAEMERMTEEMEETTEKKYINVNNNIMYFIY
jgi:hypothetical protein